MEKQRLTLNSECEIFKPLVSDGNPYIVEASPQITITELLRRINEKAE